MVQWEYYVTQRNMSDRWSAKRQQEELVTFNATLNDAGASGWELVSYESVPLTGSFSNNIKGYAYLLFFKRPKPQ
jgi:Domain of unknown function (DUF4177)